MRAPQKRNQPSFPAQTARAAPVSHPVAQATERLQMIAQKSPVVRQLKHLQTLANGTGTRPSQPVVQRARSKIGPLVSDNLTRAALSDMIELIADQVAQIGEETEIEFLSAKDVERLNRWSQAANTALQELDQHDPGDASFTWEQAQTQANATLIAIRKIVIATANARGTLNNSFESLEAKRLGDQALAQARQSSTDKDPTPKKKKEPARTPTKQGPIGLGTKWGPYNEKLAAITTVAFIQYVPEGSPTTHAKTLKDAVFHQGKAFWMSDEKKYKIADKKGKVKMVYTFSAARAKSLREDYLICGSGDFADDNEEKYTGETQHPDYTIWKPNEIGAYGIGANRLAALEGELISIKVLPA